MNFRNLLASSILFLSLINTAFAGGFWCHDGAGFAYSSVYRTCSCTNGSHYYGVNDLYTCAIDCGCEALKSTGHASHKARNLF